MSKDIEKKMLLAYIGVGRKISGENKNEINLKKEEKKPSKKK